MRIIWGTELKPYSAYLVRSGILILLIFIAACGTTRTDDVETGEIVRFQPGYPNFNFASWVEFEDREQFIRIYSAVPFSNLVYISTENQTFKNNYDLSVLIHKLNGSRRNLDNVVFSRTWQRSIELDTYAETRLDLLHVFRHKQEIKPGHYRVTVIVRDGITRKETQRSSDVYIPDFSEGSLHASSVLLQKQQQGTNRSTPVSTYYLNESSDTLKTSLQVYLSEHVENMRLEMNLLKFHADTLPAIPPHINMGMVRNTQQRGIVFHRADTIQTNIRYLNNLFGTIDIDFLMPQLSRGNYRAEINAYEGDELRFTRARDFSIMPVHFPNIRNIRDLNEAMYYITNPREYSNLTEPETPEELKEAFDTFWAEKIGNQSKARETIERYFTRIEEANSLFTTHKEGWKTDFGMIYILFGPPGYIEKQLNGEYWYYNLPYANQPVYFYFERSRSTHPNYPTDNFILQRDRMYDRFYFRKVEDWRRGNIRH